MKATLLTFPFFMMGVLIVCATGAHGMGPESAYVGFADLVPDTLPLSPPSGAGAATITVMSTAEGILAIAGFFGLLVLRWRNGRRND